LTVGQIPGRADEFDTAEIVHWTEPTPRTFARVRWLASSGHLETTAGDTVVGQHWWTPEGLIAVDAELGTSWFDTDPTRRVTLTRVNVAPRREPRGTTVLLDAFEEGSLLFAIQSLGDSRVRDRNGEWRALPPPALPSEAIGHVSIASRNVLWAAQGNGEVRRLEFDDNGALVRRGDAILSVWTSAPSIAFDETGRG
jgi:hypothetical protein